MNDDDKRTISREEFDLIGHGIGNALAHLYGVEYDLARLLFGWLLEPVEDPEKPNRAAALVVYLDERLDLFDAAYEADPDVREMLDFLRPELSDDEPDDEPERWNDPRRRMPKPLCATCGRDLSNRPFPAIVFGRDSSPYCCDFCFETRRVKPAGELEAELVKLAKVAANTSARLLSDAAHELINDLSVAQRGEVANALVDIGTQMRLIVDSLAETLLRKNPTQNGPDETCPKCESAASVKYDAIERTYRCTVCGWAT